MHVYSDSDYPKIEKLEYLYSPLAPSFTGKFQSPKIKSDEVLTRTVTKPSNKARPVFFQSTLSSHSQIKKVCLQMPANEAKKQNLLQTPKAECRNQEIEEYLPQMSKLFNSAKAIKKYL